MYPQRRFPAILLTILASAFFLAVEAIDAKSAETEKIQLAISRGQQFLLGQPLLGPQGSIASLSLVKSGIDKQTPAIQLCVQDTLAKIQSGVYRPKAQHIYETGIDLMLLEAIDSELYRPQIESITQHLIISQRPNGSWFYDFQIEPDCGDTSITQYAILGLWAAYRAGVEVPIDVWEKAARWHFSTQMSDGGFAYKPYKTKLYDIPSHHVSSDTMAAAGTNNLLIIRRVLFGDVDQDIAVVPTDTKRRFGVLEKFAEERTQKKPAGPAVATIPVREFDKSIKDGFKWTTSHYGKRSPIIQQYFCYYYYSIERVAALMDIDRFESHDWYDDGAKELLRLQSEDGSWKDDCTPIPATALALMFLSKATTTIVTPKKRISLVGGGLQIGGRGLPKELGAINVNEGIVSARKLVGSVDRLLIELEQAADAKVEDIQEAVVEAIQSDRIEALVGQVEPLRKLAADKRVEVRRTAFWALGRSGDISVAPDLIRGLEDVDQTVMREASLALCVLSRRPDGCGQPIDPLDDSQMNLNEDSTDEMRKARIQEWSDESTKRWKEWYLKIRPYDERDDRLSLKKTAK